MPSSRSSPPASSGRSVLVPLLLLLAMLASQQAGAEIVFIAPTGAQRWTRGQSHEIQWRSTCKNAKAPITVAIVGDGPDLVLSSAVPASDNHIYGWMWVVPTAMPFKAYDIEQDADRVRAKVVANCDTGNGTELQTAISNYFDIIPAPSDITLKTPKPGDLLARGEAHEISWDLTADVPRVSISVVSADATLKPIAASAPNNGKFTWVVPPEFPPGKYQLRLKTVDAPPQYDETAYTSGAFSVAAIESKILFLKPVASAQCERGMRCDAIWSLTRLVHKISLTLLADGKPLLKLAEGVKNIGRFNWTVPTTNMAFVRANGEPIKFAFQLTTVDFHHGMAVTQKISEEFTVPVPKEIIPVVTFTHPMEAERWELGSARSITWGSDNKLIPKVEVFLVPSESSTFEQAMDTKVVLSRASANTGSKEWNISEKTKLAKYYIMIIWGDRLEYPFKYMDDPKLAKKDISYSPVFSVVPAEAHVKVGAPELGIKWRRGSTHTITWFLEPQIPSVAINLVSAISGRVVSLAGSVSNSQGAFNWTIPEDQFVGDYTLRITATNAPDKFGTELIIGTAVFAVSEFCETSLAGQCSGHGMCHEEEMGACVCDPGWVGKLCEVNPEAVHYHPKLVADNRVPAMPTSKHNDSSAQSTVSQPKTTMPVTMPADLKLVAEPQVKTKHKSPVVSTLASQETSTATQVPSDVEAILKALQ